MTTPQNEPTRSDDADRKLDESADKPAEKSGHRGRVDKSAPTSTTPAPKDPRETAERGTRIGAAWTAVALAAIVLLVLLIFILQNQDPVNVHFFGTTGELPLGVALLLSAVGGALLVVVLGVARMIQLKAVARHHRKALQRK